MPAALGLAAAVVAVIPSACGNTTSDSEPNDAQVAGDSSADASDASDAAESWCPYGGLPKKECYPKDAFPYEGKTITVIKCLDKALVSRLTAP